MDAFVNALNTVLSGFKRKSVNSAQFAKQIFRDGAPLRPDEMRDRFESWLKVQTGTDDKRTVRFVRED